MTINMDTLSLYFFDLTDRGNRVFDDCVLNVIKNMKKAPKKQQEKRKENEHELRAFEPPLPPTPTPTTLPQKITVSC